MLIEYLFFLFISPFLVFFLLYFFTGTFNHFRKPTNNKDWISLCQALPFIKIEGDNVLVHNLRHAFYKDDEEDKAVVEYLNKKFNINEIVKLKLYTNHYMPFQSHTILIFVLQNGFELCISYEVRKTNFKDFFVTDVIFKKMEIFPIVSIPEDLLYVRSKVRKQTNIKLYNLNLTKIEIQSLFRLFTDNINSYTHSPRFYNIYNRNCLTEIWRPFYKLGIIKKYSNFSSIRFENTVEKSGISKK